MSLEANSVHVSPFEFCMQILPFLLLRDFRSKENIHESESTRILLAKADKLNMYIHNIHLHILAIKLISPVIAVYKQTVFLISLNFPTIPYKNFCGYPWKKMEKNKKIYMKIVYFT